MQRLYLKSWIKANRFDDKSSLAYARVTYFLIKYLSLFHCLCVTVVFTCSGSFTVLLGSFSENPYYFAPLGRAFAAKVSGIVGKSTRDFCRNKRDCCHYCWGNTCLDIVTTSVGAFGNVTNDKYFHKNSVTRARKGVRLSCFHPQKSNLIKHIRHFGKHCNNIYS